MTIHATATTSAEAVSVLQSQGYCMLRGAIECKWIDSLKVALSQELDQEPQNVVARSRRGFPVAARNLIDLLPEVRAVWRNERLLSFLQSTLGRQFGLVRVLYFDKPPDRSWGLAWHKDRAIAVKENWRPSLFFSRPTIKAGIPHVIAEDSILLQMVTLRIHLDEVDDENGPLELVPQSHVSSEAAGVGIEKAIRVHANAGDVLAMRPLITHGSGASRPGTCRHRRILHLEFSGAPSLPDGYQWRDFIAASAGIRGDLLG
ncbi:MAG: phytanoyl-CoA dioxygenase family protein [Planctomycetales bacterium]|nr:phytanoyl-CoA dioxygenase family protein [Planctomycetales bacterium]